MKKYVVVEGAENFEVIIVNAPEGENLENLVDGYFCECSSLDAAKCVLKAVSEDDFDVSGYIDQLSDLWDFVDLEELNEMRYGLGDGLDDIVSDLKRSVRSREGRKGYKCPDSNGLRVLSVGE